MGRLHAGVGVDWYNSTPRTQDTSRVNTSYKLKSSYDNFEVQQKPFAIEVHSGHNRIMGCGGGGGWGVGGIVDSNPR